MKVNFAFKVTQSHCKAINSTSETDNAQLNTKTKTCTLGKRGHKNKIKTM